MLRRSSNNRKRGMFESEVQLMLLDHHGTESVIMASKRKATAPIKLGEEKRDCISWNLSEQLSGPSEDLAEDRRHENLISNCNGYDVPNQDIKGKGRRRKKKSVAAGNPPRASFLSIEVDSASSFHSQPQQSHGAAHGLRICQLFLIGTSSESNCKFQNFEWLSGDRKRGFVEDYNLLLKVDDYRNIEKVTDACSVSILLIRKDDYNSVSWNSIEQHASIVFEGKLLLPPVIFESLNVLVKNRKLKLTFPPELLVQDQIFLDVQLVENGVEIFADEEKWAIGTPSIGKAFKMVMSYCYGIEDEWKMDGTRKTFCFTANEIPALYGHIRTHHSKRFNIATSANTSHIEKSNVLRPTESEGNLSSFFLDPKSTNYAKNHSSNDLCNYEMEKAYNDEFADSVDTEIAEVIWKCPKNVKDSEAFLDTLIPSLRPYQQAALQWMISKENETEFELGPGQHVLWHRLTSNQNSNAMFYNPTTGRVCSKLNIQPLPKGGILADEMGLGKTVEVLALISSNRRMKTFAFGKDQQFLSCTSDEISENSKGSDSIATTSNTDMSQGGFTASEEKNYCSFCGKMTCPDSSREECSDCGQYMHFACAGTQGKILERYHCALCATKEVLKSNCTLIVSPETIVYQWIDEIERHVRPGALTYFLYLGVAKSGFIQPVILAQYDIILTTYSTLSYEFHHVKTEEGRTRSLRNRKKYAALPSPLMFVEFWRVCMDEAQMIQCTTTKLAEMALRINAVHRWCVTGTPVQRGLEDIFGMLFFIGFFPYCLKSWWNKLLYEPLCQGNTKPLFDVLARVMWRTEKKDVLDQINLPEQTEATEMLKFTPVEWQFYKRQEELCTASALTEIEKWKEKGTMLSRIDKSSLLSLLAPLLRLRQACCHPRAVRDGLVGIQRSHLTMDKLLDGLTAKAKLECEEAHRQLMCALNGLAALDIIEDKIADAVSNYREAIQSWATHKDIFRTDLLQKLHTIKNLSETLQRGLGSSHTLSDDTLSQEAEELAKDYMKKPESQIASAQTKVASVEENLESERSKVDWKNPWWVSVLSRFKSAEEESALISKVKEELRSQLSSPRFMQTSFKTIDGLRYLVYSKITKLQELRADLKASLSDLQSEPSKELVLTTAACCLRPVVDSNAPRCPFCKADDIFAEYENNLFSHRGMKKNERAEDDDNKRFGGLRAETELDVVLKTIYSFARQNYSNSGSSTALDRDCQDQTKAHLKYMDWLKQEFKSLRSLWFALHKRISACDELEMSTIRIRLKYEEETSNESYIIERHEIEFQRHKLQSDRTVALHHLGRKKGQLFYLKNLEKAQNTAQDSNPDTCPICKDILGKQWGVFSCGHCFCCLCITQMEQRLGTHSGRRKGVRLDCPMCREPTLSEDISFVIMGNAKEENESKVKVKGSYSVKIAAVVKKILEIGQSDPGGKIIVFSTWQEVLSIIAQALVENDIVFRNGLGSRQKFRACLSDFKVLPSVKVLLLPLNRGSKGLNIIEATHVVLVEPTLNPANELQAIGRVHRIGQTKPTFVYRFIVRDTIEERIRELLRTKSKSEWISTDVASSSLTIGDLSSLLLDKRADANDVISTVADEGAFESGTVASTGEPFASGSSITLAVASTDVPARTNFGIQGSAASGDQAHVLGEASSTIVTDAHPFTQISDATTLQVAATVSVPKAPAASLPPTQGMP